MNRYAIELPKIGIRPCIDGRRNGVREGLEQQTMNMAKAAAKLIADNIRYPNGEPAKVIIADTSSSFPVHKSHLNCKPVHLWSMLRLRSMSQHRLPPEVELVAWRLGSGVPEVQLLWERVQKE